MKNLSRIITYLAKKTEEQELTYEDLQYIFREVRKKCDLKPKKRGKPLPQLLTESELERFFRVVASHQNTQWELLFRLLLATAMRISELLNIRPGDINFERCVIYVPRGKGGKSRYVPFPEELRLPIRQHIQAHPECEFLFCGRRGRPMTARNVQLMMNAFAVEAGIVDENGNSRVHPHLFRHQTITYLLEKGMPIEQVKQISGHSSYEALEIYNHLQLGITLSTYQKIMAGQS